MSRLMPKVVCDTAKVRFFKQITTSWGHSWRLVLLFAILQKYDFSSKSQHELLSNEIQISCLRYCKSTIFQANHNCKKDIQNFIKVVCDTAKVRFFKQITTNHAQRPALLALFAILQKYDFSSKSQPNTRRKWSWAGCLRYCKSTIFQANHNTFPSWCYWGKLFAILQKYDFSSKSQRYIRYFVS